MRAADTLPLDALAAWMDERGLPGGRIEHLLPIGGGTQNLMVRFERGGREFVLRRGPRHLRPQSNDVLRREMRVLEALRVTDVPHPRLIAACDDETVLGGAVFYLMEPVIGFNASVELPALHAADPAIRRAMGFAAVDALAALGAVDHVAVGLEGLGRPDGFLERQVPRWLAELDSYAATMAIQGRRSRTSTPSRTGSSAINRIPISRESCTATTTWRT